MDAKHPHFMVAVSLVDVKAHVEKASQYLKDGMGLYTATHIKLAIQKLAEANEELFKKGIK